MRNKAGSKEGVHGTWMGQGYGGSAHENHDADAPGEPLCLDLLIDALGPRSDVGHVAREDLERPIAITRGGKDQRSKRVGRYFSECLHTLSGS